MKKFIRILLIILAVLVVAAGSLAVWQRKNIESILVGISETTEEIEKRRDENQTQLFDELKSYLDDELREMTDEEKQQLEEGSVQLPELYSKMFEEKSEKLKEAHASNENKATKDEIISKYMAEIYKLQSEFTSRAESTISQGAAYYENLKKTQDKATARTNTITHFTPIVTGMESECDGKVEAVLSKLTNELEEIGAKTDIIGTIRTTYANEKQLKLSYYANKYLK